MSRRYPIGAEASEEGVQFRVWAPKCREVCVAIDEHSPVPLGPEGESGYFSGSVAWAIPGTRYTFQVDGGPARYPDPASRFQPKGPHGPSEVVDSKAYRWSDASWKGVAKEARVVYEMHIGTFTEGGTLASAIAHLSELATLGITVIELMPIAEFPGRFGWGYDGVNLWAPSHLYGTPDDVRRFVDAAHEHGMGVILDVVYNHFGPDGNYLTCFSDHYLTDVYENEWGDSILFDGEHSGPVREFYAANAAYWIDEFHLDGLRFDATQSIHDSRTPHILAELAKSARGAAGARPIFLVAENESQDAQLARSPEKGGFGIDALWNDDFHHSAVVALTGKREAYYVDTLGTPQELLSAVRWGYLFQGQHYAWQKARRGFAAFDLPASAFVNCLENHDQVANSARGARLHQQTSPGKLRAMTALTLLAPATPMLFQGQEFASSKPFLYFADHTPELARAVHEGRRTFLRQFPSMRQADVQEQIDAPHELRTFERCKLDHQERVTNRQWLDLHADLLRLRREDPAFAQQRTDKIAGAVLGPEAFVIRFFSDPEDRLLIVNLGSHLTLPHVPEPLLASTSRDAWKILWSSDSPRYGGFGTAPVEGEWGWHLPGCAAMVLG